jgi:hypothetical protein
MVYRLPIRLLLILRMSLGLIALSISLFAVVFFIDCTFVAPGFGHHCVFGLLSLIFASLVWRGCRTLRLLWCRLYVHPATSRWTITSTRRPPGGGSGQTAGEVVPRPPGDNPPVLSAEEEIPKDE